MVLGHSRFQKQAWCRGTPGSHNGASERSELAPLWSTGLALHHACFGVLDWPCTIPGCGGQVQGHGPAPSRLTPVSWGLAGPNPQKVNEKFKILHETGIRSTKNADFLPFGYSFEWRIDLEGSRCGLEGPI